MLTNIIVTVTLALSATSCGREARRAPEIEPELRGIFLDFMTDAKNYGRTNEIELYKLKGIHWQEDLMNTDDAFGVCNYFKSGNPVWPMEDRWIVLEPKLLNVPYLLKEVMYHELGHCLLNKGHSDNPKEIMAPVHTDKTAEETVKAYERFWKEEDNAGKMVK
jgi:hypothetical protein